jgi:hypothetical protein
MMKNRRKKELTTVYWIIYGRLIFCHRYKKAQLYGMSMVTVFKN